MPGRLHRLKVCMLTMQSCVQEATARLNLIVLLVLVIAKFPSMHKVRIFGINKY